MTKPFSLVYAIINPLSLSLISKVPRSDLVSRSLAVLQKWRVDECGIFDEAGGAPDSPVTLGIAEE